MVRFEGIEFWNWKIEERLKQNGSVIMSYSIEPLLKVTLLRCITVWLTITLHFGAYVELWNQTRIVICINQSVEWIPGICNQVLQFNIHVIAYSQIHWSMLPGVTIGHFIGVTTHFSCIPTQHLEYQNITVQPVEKMFLIVNIFKEMSPSGVWSLSWT